MTDLRELISRVERADGPDLQLDADIWAALGYDVFPAMPGDPQHLYRHRIEGTDYYDDWCVPDLTASIDAAVLLVPASALEGSNLAAWLHSALWQRVIGHIPDNGIARHVCAQALKAREADDG